MTTKALNGCFWIILFYLIIPCRIKTPLEEIHECREKPFRSTKGIKCKLLRAPPLFTWFDANISRLIARNAWLELHPTLAGQLNLTTIIQRAILGFFVGYKQLRNQPRICSHKVSWVYAKTWGLGISYPYIQQRFTVSNVTWPQWSIFA